jgi:hypothetical protein
MPVVEGGALDLLPGNLEGSFYTPFPGDFDFAAPLVQDPAGAVQSGLDYGIPVVGERPRNWVPEDLEGTFSFPLAGDFEDIAAPLVQAHVGAIYTGPSYEMPFVDGSFNGPSAPVEEDDDMFVAGGTLDFDMPPSGDF